MHFQVAIGAAALTALVFCPIANGATIRTENQSISAGRTEVLFLGTAGGPPIRSDRSEPATLLIVDGREYLIDCGIGTVRRMVEAGIDSKEIKTIFFTHLHADHDLGLAAVMANDFFERGSAGAAEPINIYGPPQTKELVDSAFQFISVGFRPFAASTPASYRAVGDHFVSPFVTHEILRGGLVFHDDKIRVTADENSHYVRMPAERRARFKSYSYRIETPHGIIVFTGDTGPTNDVAEFARGADVLVAEASYRDRADLDRSIAARAARNHVTSAAMKPFRDHFISEHLDTAAIGRLASDARVKSVILYHYNPTDKGDQAAYVKGVNQYFRGSVFAPNDLDKLCISRDERGGPSAIQSC